MRTTALVLGTLATAAAATAMAQTYYYRDYRADPDYTPPPVYVPAPDRSYYYGDRPRDERWRGERYRDQSYECWNPRAGHFENVREGEVQNDLDFGRCRIAGGGYIGPYPGARWR